jgi:hypothetical protein
MKNFHFSGKKYSIIVSGTGKFAEIYLNGTKIEGSMQLPSDLLKDENIIEIKRTAAVPDCPVLNWITDTPVYDLKSAAGQLSFKTGADVFAKMECFAASEAEIFINGQKANCEYNADTQCLWFSGSIAQNSEITIIIKNFY